MAIAWNQQFYMQLSLEVKPTPQHLIHSKDVRTLKAFHKQLDSWERVRVNMLMSQAMEWLAGGMVATGASPNAPVPAARTAAQAGGSGTQRFGGMAGGGIQRSLFQCYSGRQTATAPSGATAPAPAGTSAATAQQAGAAASPKPKRQKMETADTGIKESKIQLCAQCAYQLHAWVPRKGHRCTIEEVPLPDGKHFSGQAYLKRKGVTAEKSCTCQSCQARAAKSAASN
jgi:hypothetical protein